MNITKLGLIGVFAAVTAGCAIGPLVSHETARTVGKGHSELIGGYGMAGYAIKYNYGVADNLDLGIHWESLSIGVRAKYAFKNGGENSWSWAAAGGIGASIGGSHYYGDFTGSYLFKAFEPYATLRLVHVKNDPLEFKDQNTGEVDFTVDLPDYNYGQGIIGTRYWIDPHWLLSLEAGSVFSLTSGLSIGQAIFINGAFGYRFN